MAARTLDSWIDDQQASGRYTFLRSDASASGLSQESIKKALARLARRGRIVKLKDYFYAVVPLEYRSAGAPPPAWFIDALMHAMRRPYYVGLLSAAALHGASHQQPQEFQVVTDRSVRGIVAGRARIRLFVNKHLLRSATQRVKTPTGSMRASTPETTVLDLIRFARSGGRIDNVATVIAELIPVLAPARLLRAAKARGDIPNSQRLGYLLDRLRAKELAEPLHAWVVRRAPRPVPLRPGLRGREHRRWHVLIPDDVEVDV